MTRCKGFTLAELAIALVIVSLLLASALWPLSTQMEMRAISDTQRAMDDIKEALIGYAQTNGRLPCPADGTIATGTAGAGTEQLAGNFCTAALGVIPWSTLGVKEVDAWDRRFSYRVSPAFADLNAPLSWVTLTTTTPGSAGNQTANPPNLPCAPTPTPSAPTSFALCTVGDIAVFSPTELTRTAAPTVSVSRGAPAVIISHGKNGYGAYQTNGVRMSMPSGTHELANAAGNTTATPSNWFISSAFYSRAPTPSPSGACSDTVVGASPFCEFDDVVAWIPPSTLVSRMVSAGRLP